MLKTVKIKSRMQNLLTLPPSHIPTYRLYVVLMKFHWISQFPLVIKPHPFVDESQITPPSIHPRTKVLLAVKYTYSQFYNCSCPIFHFFVRFLYENFFQPHTKAKKHTLQGFKKGQIILIMSLGFLPIKILANIFFIFYPSGYSRTLWSPTFDLNSLFFIFS